MIITGNLINAGVGSEKMKAVYEKYREAGQFFSDCKVQAEFIVDLIAAGSNQEDVASLVANDDPAE